MSDLFTTPDPMSLSLPERCAALAQQIEDYECDLKATVKSLNLTLIRQTLALAGEALKP